MTTTTAITAAIYNPYSDETRSFNAMPLDSPLQLLPFGLLTDMIAPLVAKKRIEYRQKIQREITAELGVKMMGHYLRELDYYDKDNKVINLRRIKWRLTDKKLLLDIVLKQDIPPFYLLQFKRDYESRPSQFRIGDHVRHETMYHGRKRVQEGIVIATNKKGGILRRFESLESGFNPQKFEVMRGYVGDLQEDERYISEELINQTKCSDRGCVYKNNWCVNYNSIRGYHGYYFVDLNHSRVISQNEQDTRKRTERWEQFLQENKKRVDYSNLFLPKFYEMCPPHWLTDPPLKRNIERLFFLNHCKPWNKDLWATITITETKRRWRTYIRLSVTGSWLYGSSLQEVFQKLIDYMISRMDELGDELHSFSEGEDLYPYGLPTDHCI